MARSAALAFTLLFSGCAAPAQGPAAARPAELTGLARYLPLEDGTVFAYETSTEPASERGLLVLEVRRTTPGTAELVVAGRGRRLTLTTDAVAHAGGGFLLREPLAVGAEWHGDFGHVRVTRVGLSVSVPAGTFADCVETVEELATREGDKRTTTAFCPGVGIALRETSVEQGDERQSERIALKSFGKKFDAGAANPAPNAR
ncbi:MAG TPA: hypothetical protein VMI54_07675 [Polyangiaceae bacterium]|nr:hypothetical protein [Polyangiaceae bacterium]